MSNDSLKALEVTQADRDAAANFIISADTEAMVRWGKADSQPLVQAFARHRLSCLSSSPPERSISVAEEWTAYMDEAVSKAPEPLRQLGEYLAGLLDEDQWKAAERYLNAAAISSAPPAVTSQSVERAVVERELATLKLARGHDDAEGKSDRWYVGAIQACENILASLAEPASPLPAVEQEAADELVAMLTLYDKQADGAVVFDHTPEEIGLHVMENYGAIRTALSTPPAPASTVAEDGLREAAQIVFDGLNARIDAAVEAGQPVPLFAGIAALHDALAATPATTERRRG